MRTLSPVKLILVLITFLGFSHACSPDLPFQGFGVFLGSVGHFAESPSPNATIAQVLDRVYTDLGIRHFRTSYESSFSPAPDEYVISCSISGKDCAWISVLAEVARYPNVSVFASIWSPPHYMKNPVLDTLREEYEGAYYSFITNITYLIRDRFGIQIERVSPVNEPENFVAPWEHTNMSPSQLCRIVADMNSSLVSLCPENSYFWMSQLYYNYTDDAARISCAKSCEILASHAYMLNIDYWSLFRLSAYYDPGRYPRDTEKPIWITEVSSTYDRDPTPGNQMKEGLDLAQNIVNFLGTTCVQRYYFWSMFTHGASGESLIWGNFEPEETDRRAKRRDSPPSPSEVTLYYPKTYFVYKHFTTASFGGNKIIEDCVIFTRPSPTAPLIESRTRLCLKFRDATGSNQTKTVFVNKASSPYKLTGISCMPGSSFCCTSKEFDWFCLNTTNIPNKTIILPASSVCSCRTTDEAENVVVATKHIFDNFVN